LRTAQAKLEPLYDPFREKLREYTAAAADLADARESYVRAIHRARGLGADVPPPVSKLAQRAAKDPALRQLLYALQTYAAADL
jgi:hypothetical protein